MNTQTRRTFVRQLSLGGLALTLAPTLSAAEKDDPNRFPIGIQEYTFRQWLSSGKLDHLDYPALAKKELGVNHIEYWNRPFQDKHTDASYVGELAQRTTDAGLKNVLILIDAANQLDASSSAERDRALDEHKAWVDCAAQLSCDAIRVNCRSGGDREENLKRAEDGIGRLCDYSKEGGVKIVIEPHGGNSQDPEWLLAAVREIDRSNFGLLPDFNNFGKYDRYEGVRKTLPFAPAVCAKAIAFDDAGNETRTDFFKMMKIVYDSDYSGVISIEFEGHNVDPVAGSLKTKDLLQRAHEAAMA